MYQVKVCLLHPGDIYFPFANEKDARGFAEAAKKATFEEGMRGIYLLTPDSIIRIA